MPAQQLLQQFQNQHILDIHLLDIILVKLVLEPRLLTLREKLLPQTPNGHQIQLFMQNGQRIHIQLLWLVLVEQFQVWLFIQVLQVCQ